MSLRKLAELAKKFQVKLAQKPRPMGFAPPSDLPVGDVHSDGDPLDFERAQKDLGAITDVKDYNKTNPQTNKAAPVAQQPQIKSSPESTLPADIRAKLDTGAPGLKGMLLVTVSDNGKNVRIDYNADRWKRGANELKRILINALPGYNVSEIYGHMNPTWTTNYF